MALYTGAVSLVDAFVESLNWKKCGGLIPVIIQEEADGQVLMTGVADREAVRETLLRGNACLHSRTRNVLWMKGERSGNTLRLVRLRADCDRDALLAVVRAGAGVCHTGGWSCFSVGRGRERLGVGGYLNTRTANLKPYIPGEQPDEKSGKKIIKLNANENPYPPPPSVLEAVRAAAEERLRLYPDPSCTALRAAIAEQLGVTKEQVFASNGSDETLAFAFAAFFETRSPAILFPDVTYSFYPVYAALWGVPFAPVPLNEDFTLDIHGYFKDNGGIIFPNPNAPTGIFLPIEEVRGLAEFQYKKGKILIVDEAYIDFADGSTAVSLIRDFPNLLIIRTFSKSSSLAGLRIGYAVGNEALIGGLCRVRDSFNSYPVDRIAQAAAEAAVRDAAYYAETTRKIKAARERVRTALVGGGGGGIWTVLPSSANFLFMRHAEHSGIEMTKHLREKGILVRRFDQPRIADFLRVTIGNDEEMDFFLAALK
jgi:histidinol-phosphate aminotransferase